MGKQAARVSDQHTCPMRGSNVWHEGGPIRKAPPMFLSEAGPLRVLAIGFSATDPRIL
jgi:hypothetical protein